MRLVNLIFAKPEDKYFMDGRASSLEDQVGMPLVNRSEMGNANIEEVLTRIRSDDTNYAELVKSAFGIELDSFSEDELRKSLATFVRSIVVGDSPYDRFRRGDSSALSPQLRSGYGVFVMNCIGCHGGASLSDNRFHNIGLYPPGADRGRGFISANVLVNFAFKTPGLRDLNRRQNKLGHDAKKPIEDVLLSYRIGGTHRLSYETIDPSIIGIGISIQEAEDLRAFLKEGLVSRFDAFYNLPLD